MFPSIFFVAMGAFMTYRAHRHGAKWFQRAGLSYTGFGLLFAVFDVFSHSVWVVGMACLLVLLSLIFLVAAIVHKEPRLFQQQLR